MKLIKILDKYNIQGYSIKNPEPQLKSVMKHKYLISIINNEGKPYILDVDYIPRLLFANSCVGYVFTTESNIPPVYSIEDNEFKDIYFGRTLPICLDDYYIDCPEDINIIIECSWAANESTDILAFGNNYIRGNIERLLKSKNVGQYIRDAIEVNIQKLLLENNKFKCLSEWIDKIVHELPICELSGMPMRFPKVIKPEMLKVKKIDLSNMFVGYDIRAKNYDEEANIIKGIEDAFEDKNRIVRVYDSYNGLLDRMVKALKAKEMNYELHEDYLEVRVKDLKNLDLEYKITDFI